MAMSSAQQLGISAPSGGFQNEGWYPGSAAGSSYQYYNGTFGDSHAIHPQSPQAGAGQVVSQAVQQQSNPGTPALGSTPSGGVPNLTGDTSGGGNSAPVQGLLDQYNGYLMDAKNTYDQPQKTDQELIDQAKSIITPGQPLPTQPDLMNTYQQLRTDQGTPDLESSLTTIKQQIAALQSQTESTVLGENGKPVAMNVISGRQNQEQTQAQIQLDSLTRIKSTITDELSMRYNTINTMMQLTQQSYDNALKSYDSELQTNKAVYDAFSSEQQFQQKTKADALNTLLTGTKAELDFAYQQEQDQKKSAAANLQIYTNLITSGNMDYNTLPSDTKLQIQKMEVQSGLGVGFTQNLISNYPDGKVLYAGPNGVIMQNKDGSLKTVKINLGSSANGGTAISASQQRGNLGQAVMDMTDKLQQVASAGNNQGHIPPDVWQQALSAWQQAGFSAADFQKQFSHYADPNRGDFSSAYGFKNYAPAKNTSNKLQFAQ